MTASSGRGTKPRFVQEQLVLEGERLGISCRFQQSRGSCRLRLVAFLDAAVSVFWTTLRTFRRSQLVRKAKGIRQDGMAFGLTTGNPSIGSTKQSWGHVMTRHDCDEPWHSRNRWRTICDSRRWRTEHEDRKFGSQGTTRKKAPLVTESYPRNQSTPVSSQRPRRSLRNPAPVLLYLMASTVTTTAGRYYTDGKCLLHVICSC